MLHETTIVLYDCKPLNARMSRDSCVATHGKKRSLQFNNDQEGVPFGYEDCAKCSGVTGKGELVSVAAGPPRPPRVSVFTIDGGWGYV